MRPKVNSVDRELARMAGAAHGVVTRAELLDAGIAVGAIKRRVHSGALLPVHRGVYRVGHRAPSTEASYLAAVRACGPRAVCSGCAAGYLLSLIKGAAPPPEVTAPTQRRVPGVRTRRSSRLEPRDTSICRGVPVVNVPWALVDLATVLAPDALARACHEAGVRYRTTPADVEAVLLRRPGSAGTRRLREILGGDFHLTLSKLEARFLERLHENGLPLPETNRPVGGRRGVSPLHLR